MTNEVTVKKEDLIDLYITQGLKGKEVADRLGLKSAQVVWALCKRIGGKKNPNDRQKINLV